MKHLTWLHDTSFTAVIILRFDIKRRQMSKSSWNAAENVNKNRRQWFARFVNLYFIYSRALETCAMSKEQKKKKETWALKGWKSKWYWEKKKRNTWRNILQLIRLTGTRSATWRCILDSKSLKNKLRKFQHGVCRHNIAKTWNNSSSTVRVISERSQKCGGSSVLDACDLQVLRQRSIKNRPGSGLEIPAWAQEHFRKSLSKNTVHCAALKQRSRLYHTK